MFSLKPNVILLGNKKKRKWVRDVNKVRKIGGEFHTHIQFFELLLSVLYLIGTAAALVCGGSLFFSKINII